MQEGGGLCEILRVRTAASSRECAHGGRGCLEWCRNGMASVQARQGTFLAGISVKLVWGVDSRTTQAGSKFFPVKFSLLSNGR